MCARSGRPTPPRVFVGLRALSQCGSPRGHCPCKDRPSGDHLARRRCLAAAATRPPSAPAIELSLPRFVQSGPRSLEAGGGTERRLGSGVRFAAAMESRRARSRRPRIGRGWELASSCSSGSMVPAPSSFLFVLPVSQLTPRARCPFVHGLPRPHTTRSTVTRHRLPDTRSPRWTPNGQPPLPSSSPPPRRGRRPPRPSRKAPSRAPLVRCASCPRMRSTSTRRRRRRI